MFDYVVLNRSIDGPSISVGEIAEALLFYQSVHLILDRATLLSLIRKVGPNNVLKILSLPSVKATYIEEFLGVHTEQTPLGAEHMFISATISGGKNSGEFKSSKKRLEYALTRNNLTKSQIDNFISRFRKLVTFKTVASDHFIKGGIVSAAMNDLSDAEFVSKGAFIIAKNLIGTDSLPDNFHFEITKKNGKFTTSTNINFNKINELQMAKDVNCGEYTPAHIASGLFNASYGLILAAYYGGDFYTSEVESEIINTKNKHILMRTNINRRVQDDFHSIILNGCPDIATVINNNERDIDEFLELLKKSGRFKKWLKGASPDENIISNYIEDITSSGWINRTPVKVLRYLTTTGLGFINPAAGVLTSIVDTFLLEKINLGWNPNQFINSSLKKFVKTD